MTGALGLAGLLVFLRVSAFVAFLPPFSGRNIPNTVKVGLAVGLTFIWGLRCVPESALAISSLPTDNWVLIGWLAARETLLGASIGWLLGTILIPIRVAGAYIVQEMGLTIGGIASPTEATDSNVVSQLLEIGAVLLIFGLNVHHQFLRLFDASFQAFPLGRSWQLPDQDWVVGSLVHPVELGLVLAAPVGIILLISAVVTLFVMRQAPQFNLFTFGMPVRLLVGLVALIWFLPGMVVGIARSLQNFSSFQGL